MVPQGGAFWSEAEGKSIDTAEQRYIMNVQLMDATGTMYVNIFNNEVRNGGWRRRAWVPVLQASGCLSGSVLGPKALRWASNGLLHPVSAPALCVLCGAA